MKLRFLLSLALLASLVAADAHAQAIKVGNTFTAIAATTRGSSVAYDSTSNVYLVVGSFGALNGRFVSANGTPLSAQFPIQVSTIYTHFPRVAFSPDADGGKGAFLVTWHQSQAGGGTNVYSRMVSFPRGGPYTDPVKLNTLGLSFWELAGPNVAYGGGKFLVVWQSFPTNDIHGALVSINGEWLGSVADAAGQAAPIAASQFERDPSVAYGSGEFLVVYSGYNEGGAFGFVNAQRVSTAGRLIGGATPLYQGSGTYTTDVTFNPNTNQFLAAWFNGNSVGRLVAAGGGPAGGVTLLSNRWRAYDAVGVAHNKNTNTFFFVSHSSTPENGGVEIHPNGVPVDNGFIVTNAGGNGNFYPRIAANADGPEWLMTTANNFTSTKAQRIGSGGSVPPPPPPTDPTPAPPPPPPTGVAISMPERLRSDFNADGKADIIWQNRTTGGVAAWEMSGINRIAGDSLQPATVSDTGWKIVATADLNRDGSPDTIWQHDGGHLSAWLMQGTSLLGGQLITSSPLSDLGWKVVGAGDMNKDGWPDIIWQHTDTRLSIWYMQGLKMMGGEAISEPLSDTGWRVVGTADMDNDGYVDVVWQHSTTKTPSIWFMRGKTFRFGQSLAQTPADKNWRVAALGDYNADGRVDLLWQNSATGELSAWLMNGATLLSGVALNPGTVADTNWRIVGPR